MLDPWVIEEIRRREREKQEEHQVPLELPVELPYWREPDHENETSPPPADRGIVIIELL